MSFMAGYKTYMAAMAMAVMAMMQYMGFEIPMEVWVILNAMGLGFLRAAVEEVK